jgi:hypothetical protein
VLYDKTQTTLISYPSAKMATSFTAPDSVTTIEDDAFIYCSALVEIVLPNVTIIGYEAFALCSGLTKIELPKVTIIGDFAFGLCTRLTEITIPLSVTIMGGGAFYGWTSDQTIHVAGRFAVPDEWVSNEWYYECQAVVDFI